MLNFTTLFYANYLAKGVCLYKSLERVCDNFHLYIFSMDNDCFEILSKLNLKSATIIKLSELEDFYPQLLTIKDSRNKGEYSWTCKGPSLQYCLEKYDLESCTYLDADLYFYSNPISLYKNMSEYDVLLTDHKYTKQYDLAETNGKYCAQLMHFKASDNGIAILKWWTDLCIEWCFASHEPGRFGDQKYLDRFQEEWTNVVEMNHIGFCAPWNIQQYKVTQDNGKTKVTLVDKTDDLVFYHFHFLRNLDFGRYNEFLLGPYKLDNKVKSFIYSPYIDEIKNVTKEVDKITNVEVLASSFTNMSILRLCLHFVKNFYKRNKILWRRR